MSIITLKRNIEKYFEKHGAEIICSLAALNGNSSAFESYLEDYLLYRE
jgi:hypothetical protein